MPAECTYQAEKLARHCRPHWTVDEERSPSVGPTDPLDPGATRTSLRVAE